MEFAFIYFIVINIVGFAIMGIDKRRAKKDLWRIPERMFFLCTFVGGGYGSWLGMRVFRHKTKHWYFVLFIPLMTAVETIILLLCCYNFL